MRRRGRAVAGLLVAIASGGCVDERITQAEHIRTEACACTTPACVETAIASFADLDAQSLPSRYRPRLEALAQEIVGCMDRVLAGEATAAATGSAGSGSSAPP